MNHNLDITSIVSDVNIQRNTDGILTECLTCYSKVPLWEFRDHKIHCSATHNKNDSKLFLGLFTALWKNVSPKLNVKYTSEMNKKKTFRKDKDDESMDKDFYNSSFWWVYKEILLQLSIGVSVVILVFKISVWFIKLVYMDLVAKGTVIEWGN